MMRAYQIRSSNLPSGFNHSFQILGWEVQELTREELSKAYFWFPKNRKELADKLQGEEFDLKDSLPQAALVWKTAEGCDGEEEEKSPMIIVDGNHRSTLFLSSKGEPHKIKVVVFHVSSEEYDYYEELVHSNYLSCIYGHVTLEELREQHLKKCMNMFQQSEKRNLESP